jgi:hypothetical protein
MNLELHYKQGQALQSPATEILYGGAAGGGKSHLMRVAAIVWALAVPGLQVYLFRRTRPELLKNHMEGPTSFPVLLGSWINRKLVKINYSDLTIEFSNGSKIFLCHCQYLKDLTKYQGAEIHVLLMDELTHFVEDMYRFLRGRVRLGGLAVPEEYRGLFPRILCGSNPGSVGHNWVKLSFVDNAPPMEIRAMPKAEGGMRRQFIRAQLEDNPTLTENDPDYESRLEGLGSPELVRAMRKGDWDIVAGGMFDDLWLRDLHVVKPFEIPQSWYVDRSYDWGSSAPFSVLWWAESDGTTPARLADETTRIFPRGTLFLIAEWYGWNGKANTGLKMLTPDIAKGINEREEKMSHPVKPGPADGMIFNAGAIDNTKSIADVMAEYGVRWLEADKTPGSRKTGWQRMREYLSASLPKKDKEGHAPPMEKPGLFIFNTCHQWIRTVPVLPRDKRDADDVDTDAEDHAGDATRYRLMAPAKKVWTIA